MPSHGGIIENETSTEGAGSTEDAEEILRKRLETGRGPQVTKRLATLHSATEALGECERSPSVRFPCYRHSRQNELERIRKQIRRLKQ